jgi:hypothetical protein
MGIERYSVGFETGGTVAGGAAYAEMIAGASDPISIRSIRVTTNSNIGGTVALSRAFAVGTGTSLHTGVAQRTLGGTAMARAQTAWSQAPTGFVSKLAVDTLPVATGQVRQLWSCEEQGPLVLEPGTSLLLINGASAPSAGTLAVDITWEEGRR